MMMINQYWQDCVGQKAEDLKKYFHEQATICWHNTNECFTVEEFIIANCDYPGQWEGTIKRIVTLDDLVITVVGIRSKDGKDSVHVTSFFEMREGKIIRLDEYWGEDGQAPDWRLAKQIGRPIV